VVEECIQFRADDEWAIDDDDCSDGPCQSSSNMEQKWVGFCPLQVSLVLWEEDNTVETFVSTTFFTVVSSLRQRKGPSLERVEARLDCRYEGLFLCGGWCPRMHSVTTSCMDVFPHIGTCIDTMTVEWRTTVV
jgi:hypothetical protein